MAIVKIGDKSHVGDAATIAKALLGQGMNEGQVNAILSSVKKSAGVDVDESQIARMDVKGDIATLNAMLREAIESAEREHDASLAFALDALGLPEHTIVRVMEKDGANVIRLNIPKEQRLPPVWADLMEVGGGLVESKLKAIEPFKVDATALVSKATEVGLTARFSGERVIIGKKGNARNTKPVVLLVDPKGEYPSKAEAGTALMLHQGVERAYPGSYLRESNRGTDWDYADQEVA